MQGVVKGAKTQALTDAAGSPREVALAGLPAGFTLRSGDVADYHTLDRFHYRGGDPFSFCRVLVCECAWRSGVDHWLDRGCVEPVVGCLVESVPRLQSEGRDRSFPERWCKVEDLGDRARALTRDVRVISRLVVDPVFRGLGVAVALIRFALATAETPVTESMAAMGWVVPMFDAAGMTRFELGSPPWADGSNGRCRPVYYWRLNR